ncbi:MAG: class I SAM-dependent rRNA methyltransferase [Deltaproteobacteria bacterium]|nr:class I SAM-dependent rRNA methyltransferase [Deltaproteobacteria bacterium]
MKVNAYSERWLQRDFPWVYPKEVVGKRERGGSQVILEGPSGAKLGRAIADDGWIAARVYRQDGGPLSQAWMDEVLDAALEHRQRVVGGDTTGYRLVHGENDGLPGLRIDWWSHYAVLIADTPAVGPLLPLVTDWLIRRLTPRGIYLSYRPDPRDDRDASRFQPPAGLLYGKAPPADVRVTERGMGMLVRPHEGPDVGVYADMREVRAWLEPYWGGTSVLNTFAYTGAFSVAAALGGAAEITTVDLSPHYLERAEANFRTNELDPTPHTFLAMDTFKALDRFRRKGDRFDRVVLDPPSFSHSGEGRWSAKQDYPRLVSAAAKVVAPGGWLIAATNQGDMSPKVFRGLVIDGLRKEGRVAQELLWAHESPDFPALVSFPEGRYLKVGVWRLR